MNNYQWLTPSAPAAIAVVRVITDETTRLALMRRLAPAVGHACFGCVYAADGSVVDEVIYSRVDNHTMDIACHGGPGMRARMTAVLQDFSLRENNSDHTLSPHWQALSRAASPAAVAWLLRHGDQPPQFRSEFLFRVPVVLITGPANAGKSTLLNAWCGHQRAIVSEIPGTTRDLISGMTVVHGWRLHLIDSAGLRAGGDALEQAGQALVEQARQRADVVIYLRPPGDQGGEIGDLIVAGKADLAPLTTNGLAWSQAGIPPRSAQQLLQELGDVVLRQLALPCADERGTA
jgi:tRNA U34 5-carboxymethylaminomethyl modifying GTPase MnmE/TrmE